MSDYGDVECARYREALSARLDGEGELVDPAQVDAHLAGCAGCRQWLDDAAAVTRLIRTGPATASVDVTAAVLPAAPGAWRRWMTVGLRVLLGALGTAQLALGLVQATTMRPAQEAGLHGTTVDGATPGHLWHESAAWNVAIGAAFLWVAVRRGRPFGIVPILTVFVGVLALLSASDVLAGRVEVARLASHAFVLSGYLLVLALARPFSALLPPGGVRGRGRAELADYPAHSLAGQPAGRGAATPAEHGGRVIPFPGRRQPAAQRSWRDAA
jgi:predicted anti-sigma-YlaC factor YlaD